MVSDIPAEAGNVEKASDDAEVVKGGSAALMFWGVVMTGGRRVSDMFIGLLDIVSDDAIPSLEVEAANDVRLVDKDVVASVVPLAESFVPGGSGEVSEELVVINVVGEALARESDLALDVVSGNCESVLSV